jgi:hypothetical protein
VQLVALPVQRTLLLKYIQLKEVLVKLVELFVQRMIAATTATSSKVHLLVVRLVVVSSFTSFTLKSSSGQT